MASRTSIIVTRSFGDFASNTYVDVPVKEPARETHHDETAEVVACICCGVNETEVLKYRLADVRFHMPADSQTTDDLVQRLRGHYSTPITDGLGPAGGEEPDNPYEFVRIFPTPPIQHEAADALDRKQAHIEKLCAIIKALEENVAHGQRFWEEAVKMASALNEVVKYEFLGEQRRQGYVWDCINETLAAWRKANEQ
jgi:hypothetical protein